MAKKLKVRVSGEFQFFTPSLKVEFGRIVIENMGKFSAVFTLPDVPLTTLTALNNGLAAKMTAAAGGDREKILERNAAEADWLNGFITQANYVEHRAGGSSEIIAQSGYRSTKSETSAHQVPGLAHLTGYGNRTKGSIRAKIKSLKGAKGNLFIASEVGAVQNITAGDEKIIITLSTGQKIFIRLTTKNNTSFEGLSPGVSYRLSALAFNAIGHGGMADKLFVISP